MADTTPIGTTPIEDLDEPTDDTLVDIAEEIFDEGAISPIEYRDDVEIEVEEEENDIGEKKNPIVNIFGNEYDKDSLIIGILLVVLWGLIWRYSGLYKTLALSFNKKFSTDISFIVIFFLFIVYVLLNIVTAGVSSGGVVYELNILLTVEQMISILFGTVVLFVLFNKNLPVDDNCRPVLLKLGMSIVIILTISSLWVNVWTSGRAFRSVRKFKQGLYNIALTLFIIIGLIFLKGNKCPSIKVKSGLN